MFLYWPNCPWYIEKYFYDGFRSNETGRERLLELMDLIEGEEAKQVLRKRRFRSLKLVNLDLDASLGEVPYGVDYGRLQNGLTYYVRSNSKPRMRAALALAVKVGQVFFFLLSIFYCFSLFDCENVLWNRNSFHSSLAYYIEIGYCLWADQFWKKRTSLELLTL